jgi:hypothetical protein
MKTAMEAMTVMKTTKMMTTVMETATKTISWETVTMIKIAAGCMDEWGLMIQITHMTKTIIISSCGSFLSSIAPSASNLFFRYYQMDYWPPSLHPSSHLSRPA